MPANRKKKTMDDLMKQVESDPRLQKTIASMRESFPENPQTIRPSDRQTVRPPRHQGIIDRNTISRVCRLAQWIGADILQEHR